MSRLRSRRSPPRRPLLLAAALFALCGVPAAGGAVAGPLPRPVAPPRPPPLVVILGDSIAAGLGLPARSALAAQVEDALQAKGIRAEVRASAVSGDTTGSALDRLDFSVPREARACIIELGGNDFLQATPPRQIEDNLRRIITRLKARGVRVVLAGGRAPSGASGAYGPGFDRVFAAAARATGAVLVPDVLGAVYSRPGLVQADGLHPNPEGVRRIALRLEPATARVLKGL